MLDATVTAARMDLHWSEHSVDRGGTPPRPRESSNDLTSMSCSLLLGIHCDLLKSLPPRFQVICNKTLALSLLNGAIPVLAASFYGMSAMDAKIERF
jgi:hypothetical protein